MYVDWKKGILVHSSFHRLWSRDYYFIFPGLSITHHWSGFPSKINWRKWIHHKIDGGKETHLQDRFSLKCLSYYFCLTSQRNIILKRSTYLVYQCKFWILNRIQVRYKTITIFSSSAASFFLPLLVMKQSMVFSLLPSHGGCFNQFFTDLVKHFFYALSSLGRYEIGR